MWALLASLADAADSTTWIPHPVAGHPVFEMRTGVDDRFAGHPVLCAEISPLPWLSVEGCGTGNGFLFQADAADMAHFRARASPFKWTAGRTELSLLGGLGFAEIQSTADEPGFRFGKPQEPNPVEAAGPEASAAVHGRAYLDANGKLFTSADITAGAAYIPGAPDVIGHGGPTVPFAALTVGLGF